MKSLTFILLASIFLWMASSCSTKIDVNAPPKDIMVVYGLLDQNDSIHYIKINKAFIGENNAYQMAQDPTLSNYDPADLEVYMEEWKRAHSTQPATIAPYYDRTNTIYFDTTHIFNKEAGVFYYPDQFVWKAQQKINPANSNYDYDYEYRLFIKNKKTGKVVSASTPLIGPIEPTDRYSPSISFTKNTGVAMWKSATNGRRYELTFNVLYKEKDANGIITDHNVRLNFGYCKAPILSGGSTLTLPYGSAFYPMLASKIPVVAGITRQLMKVQMIIVAGGDELSTYIDVNNINNSPVFDRPDYSNINNGIGIFSCRHDNSIENKREYGLSDVSLDSLIHGTYTRNLNFKASI